jgi:hypothetical protein
LRKKLILLVDETNLLRNEVNRLTEFDFTNSIKTIQTKVISQFEKDLRTKLLIIDETLIKVQNKFDDFENQILRLEKVDLESKFNFVLKKLTNQFNQLETEQNNIYNKLSTEINLLKNSQEAENKRIKNLLFATMVLIVLGLFFRLFN